MLPFDKDARGGLLVNDRLLGADDKDCPTLLEDLGLTKRPREGRGLGDGASLLGVPP